MFPKVNMCIKFLKNAPDKKVIISLEAPEALEGKEGTKYI